MTTCPCSFPGHQLDHRVADELSKLARRSIKLLKALRPTRQSVPEQEAAITSLQGDLDHIHQVANTYLPEQDQEPPQRMSETAIRAYFHARRSEIDGR